MAGSVAPLPSAGAVAPSAPPPRQVDDDGPQLPVRPGVDDDLTRERAADILDGDEYQAPEPGGKTAGDRIQEWLADRLPSFDGTGPALEGASWLVVGVVAIAAVGGLVWIVATSARRRRPPEEDDDRDASVEVAPLRSPSEWADEAARCRAAGDHRGAVRAHFRVLTSTLAERRLVADTPGRTAGELRHDVAERVPGSADAFDASATLFEEVWFGDRPAGPAETERAATLTREVLRGAPRRGRSDGTDAADGDVDRAGDDDRASGGADRAGTDLDAPSPAPLASIDDPRGGPPIDPSDLDRDNGSAPGPPGPGGGRA